MGNCYRSTCIPCFQLNQISTSRTMPFTLQHHWYSYLVPSSFHEKVPFERSSCTRKEYTVLLRTDNAGTMQSAVFLMIWTRLRVRLLLLRHILVCQKMKKHRYCFDNS